MPSIVPTTAPIRSSLAAKACRGSRSFAVAVLLCWTCTSALAADDSVPRATPTKAPDQPPESAGASGLKIETRIVGLTQRVNGAGSPDGDAHTRTNYRIDVFLTLEAGAFAGARGTASAQLRAGHGRSVGTVPTYSGINSTSFDPEDGSSKTYGVVAQAYYELEWPVGAPTAGGEAPGSIKLTAGKLDVFGFFDQNRIASNENVQFINSVFVHNPLLDAGGETVPGKYGYQPGLHVGYFARGGTLEWGASLGVFASGPAAEFGEAPRRPFVIVQLEASPGPAQGQPRDNYRIYAWTNGRTSDFSGNEQRHTGIGFSGDQRFGRDWNFFQRLGRRVNGDGSFDSAVTVGGEYGGSLWGRSRDGIGLAFGWLKTSSA